LKPLRLSVTVTCADAGGRCIRPWAAATGQGGKQRAPPHSHIPSDV